MSIANQLNLQKNDNILLTTGLGLSDKGVPLRLPALLVLGLKAVRDLKKKGHEVSYTIYQASRFISETNKLKRRKSKAAARYTEHYLTEFVKAYFSDIADEVHIVTGKSCLIQESSLRHAKNKITEHINDDHEAIKTIKLYGNGHQGNAFRYAAANVLLNASIHNSYPLERFAPTGKTLIVPIGGRKEEPFFTLTKEIAAATGCPYRIEPILIESGVVPAYYPCREGDLLVGAKDETIHNFTPPPETAQDFAALEKFASLSELNKLATPPKQLRKTKLGGLAA